jgi:hypothetical protein
LAIDQYINIQALLRRELTCREAEVCEEIIIYSYQEVKGKLFILLNSLDAVHSKWSLCLFRREAKRIFIAV